MLCSVSLEIVNDDEYSTSSSYFFFSHIVVVIFEEVLRLSHFYISYDFLCIFQFFGFVAMCAYGYDAFLKYRLFGTTTTIVTQRTTVTVA